MNVFITGATGFVGRALVLRLLRDGHALRAWVRDPDRALNLLPPEVERVASSGGLDALRHAIDGCSAVIHLAGSSIAAGRWTKTRRLAMVDSRVGLASKIADALAGCRDRPAALLSASAIGYYGSRGDQWLDEGSPRGTGFLAELCGFWEAEAERARELGCRVARIRLGMVLGNEGGGLAKMVPLFRAGLGARLGSGRQWVSWIHLQDAVEVFATALTDERYDGALNAVAPSPVTNAELTAALAAVLRRKASMRVPERVFRAALGDLASVLLSSQRVVPRRLADLGFRFEWATLDRALRDVLADPDLTVERIWAGSLRPVGPSPYLTRRKPAYLLRHNTLLGAPAEEVFRFFERPEHLGALTPPSMKLRFLEKSAGALAPGAEMAFRIKVAGASVRWRTRIERVERGRLLVDAQVGGPFRSFWHEHHLKAQGGLTRMEDRVFYRPPLGIAGRALHRLFVEEALKRTFRYRRDALRLRFGGPRPRPQRAAPLQAEALPAVESAPAPEPFR